MGKKRYLEIDADVWYAIGQKIKHIRQEVKELREMLEEARRNATVIEVEEPDEEGGD